MSMKHRKFIARMSIFEEIKVKIRIYKNGKICQLMKIIIAKQEKNLKKVEKYDRNAI